MKNLRKCNVKTISYNKGKREYVTEKCYFHTWAKIGTKEMHPEDPQKDHCYSYTVGIVENVFTGQVNEVSPSDITFI